MKLIYLIVKALLTYAQLGHSELKFSRRATTAAPQIRCASGAYAPSKPWVREKVIRLKQD